MSEPKYALGSLLNGFSNYDQQVDVVCCWHGHFEQYVQAGTFDHFPVRKLPDGRELTPDFVADFEGYCMVGEICRLPNQPEGFVTSVNQAKRYLELGENVDVMMLLPHGTAAQSEKRMIDQDLLEDERVVVVSFVRNDGDATPCWVFARATQLRDISFRDEFLGEKSLHHVLTDQMDTIRVPFHYSFEQRIQFPFMNDNPPASYTACYLWQFVFNVLLSQDEYLDRVIEGAPLDIADVSMSTIAAVCDDMGIKIRGVWVAAALDLLVDAGLAVTTDKKTYTIQYGKLRARKGGSRELHQQIAERLARQNVSDMDAGEGPGSSGQTSMFDDAVADSPQLAPNAELSTSSSDT